MFWLLGNVLIERERRDKSVDTMLAVAKQACPRSVGLNIYSSWRALEC